MKKLNSPKLPKLDPKTHKGEYGRILVVGGSKDYYGAPILTALGAEAAGADLITLCLPKEHENTAKQYSLNFFLRPFDEKLISAQTKYILDYAKSSHVVVIGNGLGKTVETQKAVLKIMEKIKIPVVLDAEALFPEILNLKVSKKDWILTPHRGEFKRISGTSFSKENLKKFSQKYECTFLVKGPIDYIAQNGQIFENKTGCVQMKVGGTGDVLAGIVASYRSQGLTNFEAAQSAAYYYGLSGEKLSQNQNNFTAFDLAKLYKESPALRSGPSET